MSDTAKRQTRRVDNYHRVDCTDTTCDGCWPPDQRPSIHATAHSIPLTAYETMAAEVAQLRVINAQLQVELESANGQISVLTEALLKH